MSRPFYGWALVAALSITETVSYGILIYSFTVFIGPMRAELGWSVAAITGAFSAGLLAAGFAAVPVGRWLDRHGARALMTGGSLAAAGLLYAWSQVATLWAFYLVWLGLGLAMAAVLYEPAFAVLAAWFRRERGRALTALTFLAGFASVIFIPLAGHLTAETGWRQALRTLALVQLATAPLHGLLLRHRPEDLGLLPDGSAAAGGATEPTPGPTPTEAMREPSFWWLTAAFTLSAFVISAVSAHLVPMLQATGRAPQLAAAVGGAIGLMALPGRLVLTPLGDVWPRRYVAAAIFGLQAAGLAALLAGSGTAPLWTFVILYGAGFGAITPARAALLAEHYAGSHFGAISGRTALAASLARAAAPVAGGALVTTAGGYQALLAPLSVLSILAAGAVLAARPGRRDLPVEARS